MQKKIIAMLAGFLAFAFLITLGAIMLEKNQDDSTGNSSDILITLDRGACFGTCPVYIVSIDGEGNVNFNGQSYVNEIGLTTYKVSKENATELIQAFEDVDFFNLENEYVDQYITDIPSTTITFTKDGKTKSIYMYGLDQTIPQDLIDLASLIDKLAETEEYATYEGGI